MTTQERRPSTPRIVATFNPEGPQRVGFRRRARRNPAGDDSDAAEHGCSSDTSGSIGLTPNNSDRSDLVAARAVAIPTPIPIAVSRAPSGTIIDRTARASSQVQRCAAPPPAYGLRPA